MTGRLPLLLFVCTLAFLLPACGDGSSDLVGTWTLDKTHLEKQVYDLGLQAPEMEQAKKMLASLPAAQRAEAQKRMDGQLAQLKEMAKTQTAAMTFEAEFKSDGTVVANFNGEKKNAAWKLDGDQLTITPEGDEARTGTVRDGKIEMKIQTPGGDLVMYLVRK